MLSGEFEIILLTDGEIPHFDCDLVSALCGCFGSTTTVGPNGALPGEGELCEGEAPIEVGNTSDLILELGEGRTRLEFQPFLNEDRLEIVQGAKGMAMIVYDLQVQGNNLAGNKVYASIMVKNRLLTVASTDYIPMNRLEYVLLKDDSDFYGGPIFHPFGWNSTFDYETETFQVNVRVTVGDRTGTIAREFELIDSELD